MTTPILPDSEAIVQILKDNITFSGQVGDYVIHGAIEKLLQREKDKCIAFAKFVVDKCLYREGAMWRTSEDPGIKWFDHELYSQFLNKQV